MKHYPIGSHLKASRFCYTHHGIYIGNGLVIHYAGLCETLKSGPIEITSLSKFQGEAETIQVVHYDRSEKFSPTKIVARAKSRLGEDNYNLLFNNCEHFARWCVTGASKSRQIDKVLATVCIINPTIAPVLKLQFKTASRLFHQSKKSGFYF